MTVRKLVGLWMLAKLKFYKNMRAYTARVKSNLSTSQESSGSNLFRLLALFIIFLTIGIILGDIFIVSSLKSAQKLEKLKISEEEKEIINQLEKKIKNRKI